MKTAAQESLRDDSKTFTAPQIQQWLITTVAKALKADVGEIDVDVSFDRYGLDSSETVEIVGDLADWLGRELSPTLLYDYPTIKSLSVHLAQTA